MGLDGDCGPWDGARLLEKVLDFTGSSKAGAKINVRSRGGSAAPCVRKERIGKFPHEAAEVYGSMLARRKSALEVG